MDPAPAPPARAMQDACPAAEALLAFTEGRLEPRLRDNVANHLDRCLDCGAAVADAVRAIESHEARGTRATLTAFGAAAVQWLKVEPPLPRGTPIGKYLVIAPIGAGGLGRVYLGYDPELDRRVALKVLKGGLSSPRVENREALKTRLIHEARALARVRHPNVVHVYDVGEFGDHLLQPCIAGFLRRRRQTYLGRPPYSRVEALCTPRKRTGRTRPPGTRRLSHRTRRPAAGPCAGQCHPRWPGHRRSPQPVPIAGLQARRSSKCPCVYASFISSGVCRASRLVAAVSKTRPPLICRRPWDGGPCRAGELPLLAPAVGRADSAGAKSTRSTPQALAKRRWFGQRQRRDSEVFETLHLKLRLSIIAFAMLETSSSSVDPGHGAKVLTRALFSVAQRLDLSQLELAKMLATSASTVSRLKQGTLSHGSAEMQLAALLVRIYRSLDSLVGGDDNKAQAWLRADNSHLNGVPAELMTSIPGLVAVAEYLDAMRGKL